jgi:hypothetical protein
LLHAVLCLVFNSMHVVMWSCAGSRPLLPAQQPELFLLIGTMQAPDRAAIHAPGLAAMAAQLAPVWEEMGAGGSVGEAVRVLEETYGVQCLVLKNEQPKHVDVMGAYFIPADADVLQPAGADPAAATLLPNSLVVRGSVVGRLVGTPDDLAAGLGLRERRVFAAALRALVSQLRADYVWPGVASDERGLRVLRGEQRLRCHYSTKTSAKLPPLEQVGEAAIHCSPAACGGLCCCHHIGGMSPAGLPAVLDWPL